LIPQDAAGFVAVSFLGLVLGSFATALAHRLPRGIPVAGAVRSRCPCCSAALSAADLVPLLSWVFLRGKCRHCGASIGWQYPATELATLALCLFFYPVYGLRVETAAVYALAPVFTALAAIDLRHKIIPDVLNAAVAAVAVIAAFVAALAAVDPLQTFGTSFLSIIAAAAAYGLGAAALRAGMMRALRREPMGLGDVKFFAAAGGWLGIDPGALALFLLVSGIIGVAAALAMKKANGDAETPFGLSLVVALAVCLFFYPPVFMGF